MQHYWAYFHQWPLQRKVFLQMRLAWPDVLICGTYRTECWKGRLVGGIPVELHKRKTASHYLYIGRNPQTHIRLSRREYPRKVQRMCWMNQQPNSESEVLRMNTCWNVSFALDSSYRRHTEPMQWSQVILGAVHTYKSRLLQPIQRLLFFASLNVDRWEGSSALNFSFPSKLDEFSWCLRRGKPNTGTHPGPFAVEPRLNQRLKKDSK